MNTTTTPIEKVQEDYVPMLYSKTQMYLVLGVLISFFTTVLGVGAYIVTH